MGLLRRAFGGVSSGNGRLPRRYVWRVASHGLLGVAGLDPCGNVLLRWREGSSATGGWLRAQLVEDARVFPLHWQAAMLASSGDAKAAAEAGAPPQATTSASDSAASATNLRTILDETSGVLRILPAAGMTRPAMKRKFRVAPWATFVYKGAFYASWVAAAFAAVALYWFAKQELMSYWGRQQLSRVEEAILRGLEDFVLFLRREAIAWGVPEKIILELDAAVLAMKAAGEWIMLKAGYNRELHALDAVRDAFEEKVEARVQAWEQRKVFSWHLLGWVSVLLTFVVFFFL